MAIGATSAWSFWKTIETVSPKKVEEEAAIGFRFAIIGSEAARRRFQEQLLLNATHEELEESGNHLREFDETPDPDAARGFSFLVYVPDEEGELIGVRGANGVPLTGDVDAIIKGMLALRPDLAIALAHRLPRFRVPACQFVIRQVSRVNTQIALISALPGVLPITGIILPVSSVADTILLTKNQIVLVMRLAAAHGHKPSYSRQVKELIGTVGTALGWRTVARELVGLVPAGIGMAIKGAIAYSGTVSVGRAALWYYQTGKAPTPEQIRADYEEAQAEAREAVDELKADLKPDARPATDPDPTA